MNSGTAEARAGRLRTGRSAWGIGLLAGFVAGLAAAGTAAWIFIPRMMIVTQKSRLGFEETVSALQKSIAENGWSSSHTTDLNASLAQQGVVLSKRVKIVRLCKAAYAADVLRTDREVSCLMPCSIAVWEDDGGGVQVSKMNTGLMGKLFGGNVARVMGGFVSAEEEKILGTVLGG